MNKFGLLLSFSTSSLICFADNSNRGRLDYSHWEYEYLIPLIILLVIGLAFLFFKGKEYWKKNNGIISDLLGNVICCAVFVLIVVWFLNSYKNKESKSSSENKETTTEQKTNNDLPPAFVPVNENNIAKIFGKSDNSNSWDSHPPVITDGSGMTNKENDFLLAAIFNPSFNLHDFYKVLDMNPQNTQFLSFERYCRSNFIRERYTPSEFQKVYNNVKRAWNIFQNLSKVNMNTYEIKKYMLEYSPYDSSQPRIEDASNPQLIRNHKVKPLYYN